MDTLTPQKNLPLLFLGGLVLLTIATAFIPAKWFGIEPKSVTRARVDFSSISPSDVAEDTNNDKAISWKELIESTLGPTERSELEGKEADPKVIAELNDPNNLTASFSKNLYVASTYLSQDPNVTEEDKQDVINQLIQQEAAKITPTTYGFKDLNIASAESKASVTLYGNTVAKLLENLITEQSIAATAGAIETFLTTRDGKDLAAIETERVKVDAALKKLLAVSTPLSGAAYQAVAVNRVAAYRDTLYNLAQAGDDPIRATLFIEKYPDVLVSTLRIHNELSAYFESQNVTFLGKDPGYVFTIGYTLK